MSHEEDDDRRTKFDALPSLEVSSEAARNIKPGEGFARRVIDWLASKNVIGEHRNADKGWNVIFNGKSVRNVLNHYGSDIKVALLEHVPGLIKNGIYLATTPGSSDGLVSHVFAAKAKIDGEDSVIGFVVREDTNGKHYYDHAIRTDAVISNETESRFGARRTANAEPEITTAKPPKDLNSIFNIIKKHLAVNTQAPK